VDLDAPVGERRRGIGVVAVPEVVVVDDLLGGLLRGDRVGRPVGVPKAVALEVEAVLERIAVGVARGRGGVADVADDREVRAVGAFCRASTITR
jgi:hypothetical protein